jgi:hypothetical protein
MFSLNRNHLSNIGVSASEATHLATIASFQGKRDTEIEMRRERDKERGMEGEILRDGEGGGGRDSERYERIWILLP